MILLVVAQSWRIMDLVLPSLSFTNWAMCKLVMFFNKNYYMLEQIFLERHF